MNMLSINLDNFSDTDMLFSYEYFYCQLKTVEIVSARVKEINGSQSEAITCLHELFRVNTQMVLTEITRRNSENNLKIEEINKRVEENVEPFKNLSADQIMMYMQSLFGQTINTDLKN